MKKVGTLTLDNVSISFKEHQVKWRFYLITTNGRMLFSWYFIISMLYRRLSLRLLSFCVFFIV